MGRRRGRRGSDAAALMFMAAIAVLVVAPKIADIAARQAAALASVGSCVLAIAAVAAVLTARHRRQVRARDDARVLVALRQNSLSPSEFEEALAALCRRDGCTDVRVVGGSGDLGADVIARAPDGRRIVLQAKRYHNGRSVGSQDVQRFGGTAHTRHRETRVPEKRLISGTLATRSGRTPLRSATLAGAVCGRGMAERLRTALDGATGQAGAVAQSGRASTHGESWPRTSSSPTPFGCAAPVTKF